MRKNLHTKNVFDDASPIRRRAAASACETLKIVEKFRCCYRGIAMKRERILLLASCAALCLAIAGCGTHRWERAATDPAATEAALARCIAREAENTQRMNVPVFTRTRDGRMETLIVADRYVSPGYDRNTCMRDLGFVRVPNEASGWQDFTQAPAKR